MSQNSNLMASYQRLRKAWDIHGELTIAERCHTLRAIRACLRDRAGDFADALNKDFRSRSHHESLLTEVNLIIAAIDYTLPRIKHWAKPRKFYLEWPYFPASGKITKQPRGIAGIIGPSNYPLQLTMMPLIGSLSAGCRTLVKPPEAAPAVAQLIHDSISDTVDENILTIILGDSDIAKELCHLPLDILLFTGSYTVGLKVAEAAAKRLTPVLLELGGKSPAIVNRNSNLAVSAEAIAHGKLLNAGQTCVAPDYALVPREDVNSFTEHLVTAARKLYPNPNSGDYTAIRSDVEIGRLERLEAGHTTQAMFDIKLNKPFYDPKIILSPALNSDIMREEIFGPLLPIIPYDEIEDALSVIKSLPSPLVIYWFGETDSHFKQMNSSTSSGSVSINDTVIHAGISSLPLGGIGASGVGRYHGQAGFDSFSYERSYFYQSRLNITNMMRPPYKETADRILSWLLR